MLKRKKNGKCPLELRTIESLTSEEKKKKRRKKKPTDLKGLDKKAEKWVHSVEHCSHEIKATLFG